MPRVSRLFLAATLSTLAALLPVTALASTLTASVVGVQYAVGGLCTGGTTSSFAGFGSVPAGGQANAVFNTTICHESLTGGPAKILGGGNFQLATSELTLVGQYAYGLVVPGAPSPLYPGSTYFCKQIFAVDATLAPAGAVPEGATNISGGHAAGLLTHYGVRTADGGCHAYAATIAGTAMLEYSSTND